MRVYAYRHTTKYGRILNTSSQVENIENKLLASWNGIGINRMQVNIETAKNRIMHVMPLYMAEKNHIDNK